LNIGSKQELFAFIFVSGGRASFEIKDLEAYNGPRLQLLAPTRRFGALVP
jgi:hypothetical protein